GNLHGMDPVFHCQLVHRLLTPDGGECHPGFELAAMLSSLLTHGASLVSLAVLAYSVVQFSGYIIAFANAIADFLNQQVSFSYDARINQIVVKVTKGNTEEVIRQIPSEEMIELIARFRKDFRGLIFNRMG
ncbi:MAG: flagellar protein FlaG, partial [Candidatus Tectomicrobia bacterium]|nr:flagellar protein FlaG [Candidatus Tectomicrobia bacterium]